MIYKLPGAVLRAALVVIMITLPSALVPGQSSDGAIAVMVVALCAATYTFVEYVGNSPSLVEFRDAPPFNRLRFGALLSCVFVLSLIAQANADSSNLAQIVTLLSAYAGHIMDIPYSPVRNLVEMLPENASPATVANLRTFGGVAYLVSILSVATFIIMLRMRRWPRRRETFNVWVNLPRFDPTASGDVVARLNRDATVNIMLGFLLPFLIPVVLKLASLLFGPFTLRDPHTTIWLVTAWAFLPASLLMRGVALNRVAGLIYKKRKRAYKEAAADGMLPA